MCVYTSLVIYFDAKGDERTMNMRDIEEIVEYAEDRGKKENNEKTV